MKYRGLPSALYVSTSTNMYSGSYCFERIRRTCSLILSASFISCILSSRNNKMSVCNIAYVARATRHRVFLHPSAAAGRAPACQIAITRTQGRETRLPNSPPSTNGRLLNNHAANMQSKWLQNGNN